MYNEFEGICMAQMKFEEGSHKSANCKKKKGIEHSEKYFLVVWNGSQIRKSESIWMNVRNQSIWKLENDAEIKEGKNK